MSRDFVVYIANKSMLLLTVVSEPLPSLLRPEVPVFTKNQMVLKYISGIDATGGVTGHRDRHQYCRQIQTPVYFERTLFVSALDS